MIHLPSYKEGRAVGEAEALSFKAPMALDSVEIYDFIEEVCVEMDAREASFPPLPSSILAGYMEGHEFVRHAIAGGPEPRLWA